MEETKVTQGLLVTHTRAHLGAGAQQHGSRLETTRLNQRVGPQVQAVGSRVIRYGLALVVGWIGFMEFTGYEAAGIQPLVASSRLMSWIYSILSVRGLSTGLGVVDRGHDSGSHCSSAMVSEGVSRRKRGCRTHLSDTISFLFSAPGWEPSLGGFPALSASVRQFLIKDVVLLGAAIWTCGEVYTATNYGH